MEVRIWGEGAVTLNRVLTDGPAEKASVEQRPEGTK